MFNLVAGRRGEVTTISLRGHHVPLTNSHFWTPLDPRVQRVLVYRVLDGKLRECWLYDEDQRFVDALWSREP